MNYNFFEITLPSSDGKNKLHAEIYTPKTRSAKGVVQLAHGMQDYVARYSELADFLTGEGYIFAGHHHLGHGKTAQTAEDFGFFAEQGGVELLVEDMHVMNKYLRSQFPAIPLVLFGHSMGSFITRLYITEHPHSMRGAIIHGTGGPNPLLGMGKALASLIKAIKGPRHRSALITSLAFGSYNSKFPKEEGHNAWLTRDIAAVRGRDEDEFQNFPFTVSAFIDLFTMLGKCNSREWFEKYPKDLPTLIMSGNMDPVGDYGKGVDYVYKQLLMAGASELEIKTYDGARHELFRETNKAEVFADILSWLSGIEAFY